MNALYVLKTVYDVYANHLMNAKRSTRIQTVMQPLYPSPSPSVPPTPERQYVHLTSS
jgi:hypothetical protein